MMKTLVSVLTLAAFGMSPAVFGAAPQPESIYKTAYVSLMKGDDAGKVLKTMLDSSKQAGLTAKDVLEGAVRKGWVSQAQMNDILDIAAKYPKIDPAMAAKAKQGQLSATDLASLSKGLQGRVNGAAYWCGRYGCYHGERVYVIGTAFLLILILAVTLTVVLD